MIRDITGTHRIEATLDRTGLYCDHTVLCAQRKCDVSRWKACPIAELERSTRYDLRFLAGIIASKLVSAYYYLVLTGEGVRTGGGFHTYPDTIRKLPVPDLDLSDPKERWSHDVIVALVDQNLTLHAKMDRANTDLDRKLSERQSLTIDDQIDQLVYEIYGLTPGEVAEVEYLAR